MVFISKYIYNNYNYFNYDNYIKYIFLIIVFFFLVLLKEKIENDNF